MADPHIQMLRDWQNFYILVGTASATLTGLIFIAASLGVGLVPSDSASVHIWVTPIISHFSAVLLICILLTMPTLTTVSLSILLGLGSLIGLGYLVQIARRLQQVKSADILASDVFWQVVVPVIAYLLVLATAVGLMLNINQILTGLAVALAALLVASIRNTWDLLVWIAQQRPK